MRRSKIVWYVLSEMLLILLGLFILTEVYFCHTLSHKNVTLLVGQKWTIPDKALVLYRNDDLSQMNQSTLLANKVGKDRLLCLSFGHIDCVDLNILSKYQAEQTDFEGVIGMTYQLDVDERVPCEFQTKDKSGILLDASGHVELLNAGSYTAYQVINGFQIIPYHFTIKEPVLSASEDKVYTGELIQLFLDDYADAANNVSYFSELNNVEVRRNDLSPSTLHMVASAMAVHPGMDVISAKVRDTMCACSVIVSPDPVLETVDTMLMGESADLHIYHAIDNVTYESSDPSIVKVVDDKIYALTSGSAEITARVRNKQSAVTVEVPEPKLICESDQTEFKRGDTIQYSVENLAGDVMWTSDSDIVSIDSNGLAVANKSGTCTIMASTDLCSLSTSVRVKSEFYGEDRMPENISNGVKAMLSCVFYYEDCLQRDIAAGRKWQYSNHGWANNYFKKFDVLDSGVDGYRSCNCDSGHQWILKDIDGGKSYKSMAHYYGGGGTLKSRMEAGEVKPGDIFFGYRIGDGGKKIGHRFIYIGNGITFDTGHGSGGWHSDTSISHTDPMHAVFDTWLHPTESAFSYKGYTIEKQVRLRDDYIPKKYRNSDGELVDWDF